MAFESSAILDYSFVAAEDLSSYQYHFVVIDSSGSVRLPDSATENAVGVLQNAPQSGEAATVRILGISRVVANAAIDEGVTVKAEYVGASDAGKATTSVGSRQYTAGVCVGASAAEDDLCSVLLTPYAGIKDAA